MAEPKQIDKDGSSLRHCANLNFIVALGVFGIGIATVIISGYLQNDSFFASTGGLQKFQ